MRRGISTTSPVIVLNIKNNKHMRQRVKRVIIPYHKRTLNSRMRRESKRKDNVDTLLILLDELLK